MNILVGRASGSSSPAHHRSRAFSLIEILIAVIILALGMLGLGAVFPVVIREQKHAQDRISGTLAENNIRATFAGLEKLRRPRLLVPADFTGATIPPTTLRAEYTGLAALQEDWVYHAEVNRAEAAAANSGGFPVLNFRPGSLNQFTFSSDGQWETFWGFNNPHDQSFGGSYYFRGDVEFVSDNLPVEPAVAAEFPKFEIDARRSLLIQRGLPTVLQFERRFREFRIPLAARLNPAGDPGDESPSMVWDFVVRRKLETTDPRALQVAVFVRRIDPRLRSIPRSAPRPGDDTVSVREQFFSRTLGTGEERLPLGEDREFLPTLDGGDGAGGVFYSGVHSVGALFQFTINDPISRKRDRIFIGGAYSDPFLIAQRGQRVVDNLGNIYTIVGSSLDDFPGFPVSWIKVDPPVPPSVIESDGGIDFDRPMIRQLIFTPQIPVSVFMVEVEP